MTARFIRRREDQRKQRGSAVPLSAQADFYDDRWAKSRFVEAPRLRRCVEILSALEDLKVSRPRILDLGCGEGWFAGVLSGIGPTTGIDLSEQAVAEAQERYPSVTFLAGNLFSLDLPTAAFDVVVSQEVIEHVADQVGYLEICHRVLVDGGSLFLTTPNRKMFECRRDHDEYLRIEGQPLENWLGIGELKAMFDSVGFETSRITTIVPGGSNCIGWRGVVNSTRLKLLADSLGVRSAFDHVRLRARLGVHILAIARKASR